MEKLILKYTDKVTAILNLRDDIEFELKVIERNGDSAMVKEEWIILNKACLKQLDCYQEILGDLKKL